MLRRFHSRALATSFATSSRFLSSNFDGSEGPTTSSSATPKHPAQAQNQQHQHPFLKVLPQSWVDASVAAQNESFTQMSMAQLTSRLTTMFTNRALMAGAAGKVDKKAAVTLAMDHVKKFLGGGNNKGGGDGNKNGDGKDNKGDGKDDKKNDNEDEKDDVPEDEMTPKIARFVAAIIVASLGLYLISLPRGTHTSWLDLENNAKDVTSIGIFHNFAQVYTEEGKRYVGVVGDGHTSEHINRIREKRDSDAEEITVDYLGTGYAESALQLLGMIAWVAPFIFFPGFVLALTQSLGQVAQASSGASSKLSKGKLFMVQKGSTTRFSDIAGMKEPKREITEIVDFLKQPQRYTRLGAKIPTGALLLGPPGTGKTLLAKAVAGEAGVAFIPTCGSDFVELYVGMGALRVRQLFETAKKQRCIVYIDEIDAIGMKRSGKGTGGEHQETEQTLNELLTQLDGFGTERGEVMILASSNVGQDSLDKALIRPGRFDRLIHVDAPVISERQEIFKVHLKKLFLVKAERDEDLNDMDAAVPTFMAEGSTIAAEAVKPADAAADAADVVAKAEAEAYHNTKEAAAVPLVENEEAPKKTATAAKATEEVTSSQLLIVPQPEPETKAAATAADIDTAPKTEDDLRTASEQEADEKKKEEEDAWSPKKKAVMKRKNELIDSYAKRMSDLCPGFVGADIANVCNEAAILAAREDATFVHINHLERSIDRVLAGIEHRSRVLSDFEKNVVAHHEAGHAVAGWFLNRADPLMKVSIVPRGGSALGYAQYLPNENHLKTSQELLDSICVTLGGRVAEDIFFGHLSTGASDDLQKVCRMAYMHVANFNTKTAHPAPGTEHTKYIKPFGSHVSDKMDLAAKELVDKMYERTTELLKKHKKEMEVLAEHLKKHEVLTHSDVVKYLGQREKRESDRKIGA